MIRLLNKPAVSQSRDVKPIYKNPLDEDYSFADYGRPIKMECAKMVRLRIDVDLVYTKDESEKVKGAFRAVSRLLLDAQGGEG